MTQSRFPLSLPPVDIVRQAGEFLEPGVPRTILDAGMGLGRNTIHLARLGHFVTGISNDLGEVRAVEELAEMEGVADRCKLQLQDVRELPPGSFDIVLLNEVTHLFSKSASNQILDTIRHRTKQGGLNIVSGYVVRPGTANITNTSRCFAPDELQQNYEAAGWTPVRYHEEWQPIQHIGTPRREIISSRAKIIAQRPWIT